MFGERCAAGGGTVLSPKQAGSVTHAQWRGRSSSLQPEVALITYSQPSLKNLGRVHLKIRLTGNRGQAEPRPPGIAFIREQCHLMVDGAIWGRQRTEPKATWMAKLLHWDPDMTVSSRTRTLNYYKSLFKSWVFKNLKSKNRLALAFPGAENWTISTSKFLYPISKPQCD